jgi:hypothetical protein
MEFRILGSFEVIGSAGLNDLRGARRRGLLACLVVHVGQPLSTDRLVEELWGGGGSGGAARTVQTYVSQLRRLLGDEEASLLTRPGGYVLEIDPADVDAYRFERARAASIAEPNPARRLAMVDEGLELWRGPPLDEFAGAGWADGRLPGSRHYTFRSCKAGLTLSSTSTELGKRSPSSKRWRLRITWTTGCAPSSCSPFTAVVGRPMPSPPTSRRDADSSTSWASNPAPT